MAGKPRIIQLKKNHLKAATQLFRRCFPLEKTHAHGAWNPSGKSMSGERLQRRVFNRDFFNPKGAFALVDRDKVVGFCIAVYNPKGNPKAGGISVLTVDKRYRRKGHGAALLNRAEQFLKQCGAKQINLGFAGCPVSILGGVPLNEEAYPFILNRGYRPKGGENLLQVMSADPTKFQMTPAMKKRIKKLEKDGVRLGYYRPSQQAALERFMKKNFPGWFSGVVGGATRPSNPRSLLVASRKNTVLGYAGPFHITAAKTATFSSVGVAKSARGLGLGAAVFNLMCEEMRKAGANLVSLTTGIDNPAQEIYSRAGFRAQFVIDYNMTKII